MYRPLYGKVGGVGRGCPFCQNPSRGGDIGNFVIETETVDENFIFRTIECGDCGQRHIEVYNYINTLNPNVVESYLERNKKKENS